uniref:Uncharacterized protein n=1 Tax=Oryza punctata TaxID=4537 RepID=A0A0E0KNF7_ORYPU
MQGVLGLDDMVGAAWSLISPSIHPLVGANKTGKWSNDVDRLQLAFDGVSVNVLGELGARWDSTTVPGIIVTTTAATNGVIV